MTPSGAVSVSWTGQTIGIACADGILYAADLTAGSVVEYDVSGKLTTLATCIQNPEGIAIGTAPPGAKAFPPLRRQ